MMPQVRNQVNTDEFFIDEKFGKVPIGWEVMKLRNIASDIIMGQSPSSDSYNSENIGLPYVQGNTDMSDKYPKIRMFTSDPKKLSIKDDILISVRAPVGELFINNLERIAIGRGFGAIRFEDQNLAKYFFQFFMHDTKQFIRLEQGTTFTEIGKKEVRNLRIPLPPLPEQRAIASVLSKVDDAIAATKKTIAKAERLKKALMQNLLTGRLKPDGIRRNDDEFYTDEKFGKVPKGWEVKKVKDCFEFFPTSSYSRSKLIEKGECMYIHYGDIHTKFYCFINVRNSHLPFITSEMADKYTKITEGDLVMADASEDYDGVGKCVEIMKIDYSNVIAGLHTLHFRDKSDNFVNGYKGYMFNNEKVRNSILRTATGIKVYSVSKSSLAYILLPVPPKEEQKIIANRIDTMNNSIQSKELKIQKLERLKKALMQNLLTGKVRLKPEYIKEFTNG